MPWTIHIFRRLRPEQIDDFIAALRLDATVVDLTEHVHGIATHPEDDLVLSAALSAHASYLVTGDVQLQRLTRVESTTIITPAAFLDMLEATTGERLH